MRFIGPPLLDSFRDIAGLDEVTTLEAMAVYRGYFVEYGMFENSVYPGIPGLLRELVDTGRRLAVATSKPLPYAVPIIEHFALAEYFEAVFGPAIDGDGTEKGDVVAQALSSLHADRGDVVLVGDRVARRRWRARERHRHASARCGATARARSLRTPKPSRRTSTS